MNGKPSSARAWARALERTAPIVRSPHRILPTVIEELAEKLGDAPALLSDGECLTYRALAQRSTRYARWAIGQELAQGSPWVSVNKRVLAIYEIGIELITTDPEQRLVA